jgi:hypothetical protein
MYQERDLAVVAIAALGAGYLVGASLHRAPAAVADASSGMTIVKRLELQPPPRKVIEHWEGDVLRVALTPAPLMIQTPPWQDAEPTPQLVEPQVTPQERAMLQQQQEPEKPRDGCYPGHREEFYYKRVLHWRCKYGR